ncbi:glycosyl transferase [Synergistales bacterium]|nr:glycosyl transferase [Synergistales bacterium]
MNIPRPESGDRVLWIRFWAFGDALEAAADAYNFKKRFPDIHLAFLSNPEYAELFRAQPYFDEVLAGRKKPFAEWWKTLQKIRAGHYKWIVSAHYGGRTSLLACFSRASWRIGVSSLFPFSYNYHIDPESWFKSYDLNVKDRSSPSIFVAASDREAARVMLERLPERRLFVLIGAGKVKKMWDTERWVELLRSLVDRGWGIVLNGHGPIEEAIGQRIESALSSPNLLNLVGALNFRKMSGVAHACTLALGNDTGPLHLAALSGVPTMGLFSQSRSQAMGLRMPWFRELCAEDLVPGNKHVIPLKALPVEPVSKAFDAFAEEFLPKAFAYRDRMKATTNIVKPTPPAL